MDLPQGKPNYQRKNIYIDQDFQNRFILKFCALVVAGTAVTIVALYFLSRHSTSVAFVDARVKVMTTADFLLPLMVQTLIIVMGFVSAATVVVTLYVSHKIAGPLYRFKQTFRELTVGNFTRPVTLRKGDQLLDVAGDFNRMIMVLSTQLVEAKKILQTLKADIDAIGADNVDESRRQRFLALQNKVRDLEKSLEFFKT